MKNLKTYVVWLTFTLLFVSLVICCRKSDQVKSEDNTPVSPNELALIKNWHKTNTSAQPTGNISSGLAVSSNQVRAILNPIWDQAKHQTLASGEQVIVVPAPEAEISNKGVEFFRTFVFKIKDNAVVEGNIYEFVSKTGNVSKIGDIPAKIGASGITNYTGAELKYDVKYNYVSSVHFKNGVKDNATPYLQRMKKSSSAQVNSTNLRVASTLKPMDGETVCWNVYWIDYYSDGSQEATYLYSYCESYNGGGPMGGGGGGGETPPPSSGPGSASGAVENLISNVTQFTPEQRQLLQKVLDQITKYCLGNTLDEYFVSNNIRFTFNIDPNSSFPAYYNPSQESITIKDPSTLNWENFQEELMHALQNHTMPGGTSQYLPPNAGSANIEFETKFTKDLEATVLGIPIMYAVQNDSNYVTWLYSITQDGSKYPSWTEIQSQYYNYMQEWLTQQTAANTNYKNDVINYNLQPTSMLSLIQSSPCSK